MRVLSLITLVAVGLAGCAAEAPSEATQELTLDVTPLEELPTVDAEALLADLYDFSKQFNERADNLADHVGARDHMAAQYEELGLEVWRQEFTNGIDQENIVGIKWGADPNKWVVVGGHYDMVTTDCIAQCVTRPYSEGAYDDGSGTVMTMHLAKVFADIDTPYTIAFANFDGEERGLQGSRAFAEAIIDKEVETPYPDAQVIGMLDLDMFGLNWPGVDAPIFFDENSDAVRAAAAASAADMGMPDDMIEYHGISLGRSDYAHFMDRGIPTGFFISDFEKWQLPADLPMVVDAPGSAYPFWHVQDTYETMELMAGSPEDLQSGFQAASDLAQAVLYRMAMDTTPMDVRA